MAASTDTSVQTLWALYFDSVNVQAKHWDIPDMGTSLKLI
jgi:hypothetical protein